VTIFHRLLETLQDGKVREVRIGLHWTAVVVDIAGEQRCGLAATLFERQDHAHAPVVPQAGELQDATGRELADLVLSGQPTLISVGMAAINAMLPRNSDIYVEANAEDLIAQQGTGKRVALVGHFPFVPRLRQLVGELSVLELHPEPGDIPADQAPLILPIAQVVAVTGMALLNGTLESLLELCPQDAFVMVLGPSTPLSPVLFEFGVNLLSGSIVTMVDPVLRTASQGGNFRQLHRAGVKLVNIERDKKETR
jgi:uncharacterized protein